MKKYILLIIGLLVAMMGIAQSTVTIENISYRIYSDKDSATVYQNNSNTALSNVIIPDSITNNGIKYPVKLIEYWKYGKQVNMTLPSTIEIVSLNNFNSNIGTLRFSKNVEVVSTAASSINRITAFEVDEANLKYTAVDGVLYTKDMKLLSAYPGLKTADKYIMPNSVQTVAFAAFAVNTNLKQITLSSGLTSIESYAFNGCANLLDVNLPNSLTSIGNYAFQGCTSLTSAIFRTNLESIGNYAFQNCTALANVAFPNGTSLTSIGTQAFYGCTALTSVKLPNSVTSIGSKAFYANRSMKYMTMPEGCPDMALGDIINISYSLDTLRISKATTLNGASFTGTSSWYRSSVLHFDVEEGNPNFMSIDGLLYDNNKVLLCYPFRKGLTELTLPEGVKGIGSYAFCGNTALTSITLPESLEDIGMYAFSGCTALVGVAFPTGDKLTSIGDYAFNGCTLMTSIKLPNSVSLIGANAFYANRALKYMTMPEGIPNLTLSNIINTSYNIDTLHVSKATTFSGITFTTESQWYRSRVLHFDVEEGNPNFSSVEGLLYDGNKVLICYPTRKGLAEITIPDGMKGIGNYVFYGNTVLTKITMPTGLETIGDYAFRGATSLKDVTISDGLISIGNYAFYGVNKLESLTLPTGLETIGNYAFNGANKLEKLNLPEGLKIIGEYAFTGNTVLKDLSFPSTLESIGQYAFQNVGNLKRVELPATVTFIGNRAFWGLNLEAMTMPEGFPTMDLWSICSGSIDTLIVSKTTSFEGVDFSTTNINYAGGKYRNYVLHFQVEANNPKFSSADGMLLNADKVLLFYPYRRDIAVDSISEGVKGIGVNAFYQNNRVEMLKLPTTLESIASAAFYGCTLLRQVTIPAVKTIGSQAFYGCSKMTNIDFPVGLTSIGSEAFRNCTELIEAIFPNTLQSIGSQAFWYQYENQSKLKRISLPKSLTSLGEDVFNRNAPEYVEVNIEGTMDLYQFYDMNIDTLKVSKQTVLENYCPANSDNHCGRARTAYFIIEEGHPTMSSVDGVLFNVDKTQLLCYPMRRNDVTYTVPATVTSIGNYAFYVNSKLERLVLPEGLTSIGDYAFYNNNRLNEIAVSGSQTQTGVAFPTTLKTLGNYSFSDCYSLIPTNNTLTLPANLSFVGNRSFSNAFKSSNKVIVVFPSSLGQSGSQVKVYDYAFNNSIIRSEMQDPVSCEGYDAFVDVGSIYIPKGTMDTYKAKQGWNRDENKLKETSTLVVDPDKYTVGPVKIIPVLDLQNRLISVRLDCDTIGAVIRYRTYMGSDNTDPVEWAKYQPSGADGASATAADSLIALSDGETIRAIAMKDGYNNSNIYDYTANYTSQTCKQPTINCATNSTTMTMSVTEDNSAIYYTTDGSIPIVADSLKYKGTITLDGNFTYKAIAYQDGMFASEPVETTVNWFRCQSPTITYVAESPTSNNVIVTVKGKDEKDQLMCWQSGENELMYVNPRTISRDTYFSAYAKRDHYNSSTETQIYLSSSSITCAKPIIAVDPDSHTLSFTCDTEDASIYYTLDNTTPQVADSLKYKGTVTLEGNCTIRAIAHKKDMFQSAEASTTVGDWFGVAAVVAEKVIENGAPAYKLTTDTPDAVIHYGISDYYYANNYDDSVYEHPVVVPDGWYIFYYATKDGYNSSSQVRQQMSFTGYTRTVRPTISLDAEARKVVITTDEDNAEIYYTTDGTQPTTASTKYTEPFITEKNCEVKAITAHITTEADSLVTYINSPISSKTLDDLFRLQQVQFDPVITEEGLKMRLVSPDEGTTISWWTYYNNTWREYTDTITISTDDYYLYAVANKDGWVQSTENSFYVNENNFKVSALVVNGNSETKVIRVSCATEGATIYYTTDGTEPTIASTPLTADTIKATGNLTYKFIAVKEKRKDSDVYTYSVTSWFNCGTPVATWVAAAPTGDQLLVTLTGANEGETLRYSLDGNLKYVYKEPVLVNNGSNFYAYVDRDNYNSRSGSWYVSKDNLVCTTPSFDDIDMENNTVAIKTSQEGATIYYTMDGTDPNLESAVYTEPIKLDHNCTIRAIGYKKDMFQSSVRSRTISYFGISDVMAEQVVENGVPCFKLSTETDGAIIRYGIASYNYANNYNDSIYEEPIAVPDGWYLFYYSTKDGFNSSTQQRQRMSYSSYTRTAQPTISLDTETRKVVIASDEDNTEIYYTIDGTDPTTASTKYSAPFNTDVNCEVRAITAHVASATDSLTYINSYVASRTLDDFFRLQPVQFDPILAEDGTYKMRLVSPDDGTTISWWTYYNNERREYSDTISISADDYYLYAVANKDGWVQSNQNSFYITANNFKVSSVTVNANADTKVLRVTCPTEGASIYYTVDGTDPTTSSTQLDGDSIVVTGNMEYRFLAVRENRTSSDIYTYKITNWFNCGTPVATWIAAAPTGDQLLVTLTGANEGETLRYSLDGNLKYTYKEPVLVNNYSYIYAYVDRDYYNSRNANWYVTKSNLTCNTPTFGDINMENNTVALSTTQDGAKIYYTIDGSAPTPESMLYTTPIKLDHNCTIRAIGYKKDMFQSSETSLNVSYFTVSDVAMEQITDNGQILMKLSCTTPGATIWYGINSRDRYTIENNTEYTAPIAASNDATVYCIATKENFNNSAWNSQRLNYNLNDSVVICQNPSYILDSEKRVITLSTSEPNGIIYYTLDGTTPSPDSTNISTYKYIEPFTVSQNGTLKAITVKGDTIEHMTYLNSDVVSTSLDDVFRLYNVDFTPVLGDNANEYKMVLSTRDEGTTIFYRHSNTNNAWVNYVSGDSITVPVGEYVYSYAEKEGWVNSSQTSFYVSSNSYTVSTPNVRTNTETKMLVVTCETPDAVIYYTTNGEEPTVSSTKLTNDTIILTRNNTYKFIGTRERMYNSSVNTVALTDWFRVPNVLMEPFAENDTLKIRLTCDEPDATIYYGYSGNYNANQVNTNNLYTGPFAVNDGARVYASAIKEGYNDAYWQNSGYLYRSNYTCQSPGITVASDSKVVTLTNNENGSTIYYTLDGTDPTTKSKLYTDKFTLYQNAEIKAISVLNGKLNSSVSSYSFTGYKVETVKITPFVADNVLKIKLETTTPGAKIYYNINERNTEMVEANLPYAEPFDIPDGASVYACAVKDGYTDASWASQTRMYYSTYTCNQPTITVKSDTTVVMTCSTQGATIRYTLDGTEPTAESTAYSSSFKLTRNSDIRAVAMKDGLINSAQRQSKYNNFYVPQVVLTPFAVNDTLKMQLTCPDHNADIYYSMGNNLNAENVKANLRYTAPFEITDGILVQATAVREGFNNAAIAGGNYYANSYKSSQPVITIGSDATVTITANEGATIYYTIDGSVPTIKEEQKYSKSFKLTRNCTVKAIALEKEHLKSELQSRDYSGFIVSQVVIEPFVEGNTLKVRLKTETPNAQIYYNIGEYDNMVTANIPYEVPFVISDGVKVFANATRAGYNEAGWNSTDNIFVSNYTCNPPTLTIMADTTVVISSEEGATVYYTMDGTNPTVNSSKYEAPIKLTRNCTVRAMAVAANKINSSVQSRSYSSFRVGEIEFAQVGSKITMTCATPEAVIYYVYGSENVIQVDNSSNSHRYNGTFELMDNSELRAIAYLDGWNNSEVYRFSPISTVTCPMVEKVDYDGHLLELRAIDGATIWYTTNGNNPFNNSDGKEDWIFQYDPNAKIAVNGTGVIKAMATRNYMNDSEVANFEINFYAGENGTSLETAGVLEEVMSWSDPSTITSFDIEGPLNQKDLKYIKENMTNIQTLDMSRTTIEDGILPDSAFVGLPIISFVSPDKVTTVGKGIFADCSDLAAVQWKSKTKLPDDAFGDKEHRNPNMLLYVDFEDTAPSRSVVDNLIINGTAQSIMLVDAEGFNFYCPVEFNCDRVSYTHNFQMESGEGAGWEAIALPFTATNIQHESKGELLPFLTWQENGYPENYKPFWVRSLSETGFTDVATMEANKPYIVCMPNNEDYAMRFRLGGKVTFSATNTKVPVTNPQSSIKNDVTLTANFIHREAEEQLFALNREDDGQHKPGSTFLKGNRPLQAFEAYATSKSEARQAFFIVEVEETTTAIRDLLNEAVGKEQVRVFNLSGTLVKIGRRDEVIKQLSSGVYIVNGEKILVK